MSIEVIVSVVTAGVSAAASIVAAMIQAGGKGRARDAPAAPRRGLSATITNIDFGEATRGRGGVDGVWLALVLVLAVESVALATRDAEFSAGLNSVIVIPAVTLVMALARPIGWGYAAGAVTLLHGVVLAASMALARGAWESSTQVFFLSFVANALLVGGVAFLRTKAKPAALGGVFATLGVLASAWLFVPMLVARPRPPVCVRAAARTGRRPEPEPERAEIERMREVTRVRVRRPGDEPEPEPQPEVERPSPPENLGRTFRIKPRQFRPVAPDAR